MPLVQAVLPGDGRVALEVSHLRKTYGATVAVDDVSFSVDEGEIFGILGPNGAGKTTTVECAIGLRSPDSGTIHVMGLNPNTVQLASPDSELRWSGRLWPVPVMGPFHVPFRHLALDDVGVGPSATDRVEAPEQLHDRLTPGGLGRARVLRGEKRPVGRPIGGRCATR
jgi:energy-coupling factor transporter ATP-binding protein EcfA2